jgi:uncharacterized protein (DUF1499 family)
MKPGGDEQAAGRDRRGRWPQRLVVLSLVLLAIGPLLAHFEVVPALVGFSLFALGGFLAAGASIAGFVTALRGATVRGMRACFGGMVVAGLFFWLAISRSSAPRINDVSTNLEDPPELVAARDAPANRGRDLSFPEPFKQVIADGYPSLQPLRLPGTPEQVFERALFLARTRPDWRITHADRDRLTFEGEATSELFRFRDDFVVRVRPAPEGAVLDMRSKSRDGQGDLGANARRIEEFFALLR